jgi:CRISPR-associated exonuclease Cas4
VKTEETTEATKMDDYLAISALQHYAYCPRQFALIHVEQAWEENRFTAEGKVLHERVDSGKAEQRGKLRYERSVLLKSERYRIQGKMDLLEIESGEPPRFLPVEYKRGKPKIEDWDRIQVCAQALCLEEMRETSITEGALWYWEVRRREPVTIDQTLRATTIAMIDGARQLLLNGQTAPPTDNKKRCKGCSLKEICQPDTFRKDRSATYINKLFES